VLIVLNKIQVFNNQMPWPPFRRRVKHKPLRDEVELETCFDENLSRSLSDGNLVRAPSERFLLSNINPRRSYGTCQSSNTGHWTSFTDHTVQQGDTLAGLSIRYDITIQDIKLANSLWTNEGLYTGRILRIPVIDPGHTNLDLTTSDSISSSSRKSSTDQSRDASTQSTTSTSRTSADLLDLSSDGGGACHPPAAAAVPRGGTTGAAPPRGTPSPSSFNSNNITTSSVNNNCDKQSSAHQSNVPLGRRASVDELKDFLKKMDMSIALGRQATHSMVNKSIAASDQTTATATPPQDATLDFMA